jgi:signal transduction histidine kinase
MLAVIAVLALIVAALYGFIGLYIVPRLARLAVRKGSLISVAPYGAAAFFLGCAMTHVAIAVHTLVEPNLVKGHEWFHLAPHILQVVGGTLFSVIAWTRLDVKLRTKEDARLEEESERLRDQLERSQRLGSLGQLAGGLAHDFNNLLVVILGYGRLLEEKLDGDPASRADIKEIVGAAQRGADLTRQMLVFSRGPEVSLDATDVNHAVEASVTLLRRAVGESVRVELGLAGGLPLVRLGRGQVEQVLLNLALNARDAMPGGGALKIQTALLAPRDGGDAGWVKLTVADTGQGMSSEVLAKAFDPFFTTKPEGEGTGLGLSMVYGMVERVGSRVDLDSAPGRGTRITIELPGAQAASTEEVHEREPLQMHGVTVLSSRTSVPCAPSPPVRSPTAAR